MTLDLFPSQHSFRLDAGAIAPLSGRVFPCVTRSGRPWSRPQPRSAWRRRSPRSTPAEAQWHGGGGFHGGGFHGGFGGGGFHGGGFRGGWGGGWHGGWGRPGWGGGWGRPGWGGGWGWRRAGWGGGWGPGWGWGGGCWNCGWGWGWIRAGRSPPRPCPSGSRSLRSRSMAAVLVAGSGGGLGPPAGIILARAREPLLLRPQPVSASICIRGRAFKDRKTQAPIMNICSTLIANTCL